MKRFGYSLIELIIAMSVLLVVMCFSVPFLHTLRARQHVEGAVQQVTQMIQFSRLSAYARHETLILKPTRLGETALAAGDWSLGAELYSAEDKYAKEPIRAWKWSVSGLHVRWQGFISEHFLVFTPSLKQAAMNGVFSITYQDEIRRVRLNRLGRVSLTPNWG